MGLDSYRVKETKKVVEKPRYVAENTKPLSQRLKDLLGDLPQENVRIQDNTDIDQTWIREHEAAEVKRESTTSTQAQPRENMKTEVQRLKDFLRDLPQENADIGQSSIKEHETEEVKQQPITSTQTQPVNLSFPSAHDTTFISSDVKEPLEHISEIISTSIEIPQVDNSALIEQLNANIDKKYSFLNSQLPNVYNSELLQQEVHSIATDLKDVMDIKNRSLEELQKADRTLDSLISRFAKLSQKAYEIKATDDFRINQQAKQMVFLEEYQVGLEKKYGKYWFGKMTEQEKEQYIQLYSSAHKVSRETVEKQIEDSIVIAYNEIVASKKQNSQPQSQNNNQKLQSEEQQFHGNYEDIIKFEVRQAVETLKQIHSSMQFAIPEQIYEFNFIYGSLSSLSKVRPKNLEEEQEKLTSLNDLTDRISQLQVELDSVIKTK